MDGFTIALNAQSLRETCLVLLSLIQREAKSILTSVLEQAHMFQYLESLTLAISILA
jgi:hypothetical protein